MSALLATLALLGSDLPTHDAAAFVETVVRIPREGARLALRDFTGNGALDLVRAGIDGLELFPLRADRTFAPEPSARLAWPSGRVGWNLADLDGDGAVEVVLIVDGKTVRVHRVLEDGTFDEGRDILEARASLPAGTNRVRFTRDVDGDGRIDLVLPGSGSHHIYLARDSGWAEPIEVAYELDASYDVGDPESLSSSFGQRVRVPWFRIEDVDGDGRADLVSETTERIAFHLASPELSSEPSWVLDLAALRDELPKRRGIDFDDLFSALDQIVSWRLADLDGEGARDLIVVLGSKLRMYLGGAATGPTETPDQVLKSSGNVLWTFIRQVEGDELPDLQIVRAERVSIGRVLRSLILPSSLDFDFYTYRNEAGKFSRKPTRRNRLTLKVPRLLAFMDDAEGLETRIEDQFDIHCRRLPRVPGTPAAGDDIVDIVGEELVVYPGCAPEAVFMEWVIGGDFDPERFVEGFFLDEFDAGGDGHEKVIDIGDVETYDFAPGAVLRSACEGVEPSARHALAVEEEKVWGVSVKDLDGDGRADVIVIGETDQEWVIQFLVRAE